VDADTLTPLASENVTIAAFHFVAFGPAKLGPSLERVDRHDAAAVAAVNSHRCVFPHNAPDRRFGVLPAPHDSDCDER
jgi:hypothetical protein